MININKFIQEVQDLESDLFEKTEKYCKFPDCSKELKNYYGGKKQCLDEISYFIKKYLET